MTLPPNTRLGRYEIKSLLGAGGMGEVYLAEDTKLDRRVALKILPPEFAADKDRMNRFVREAKSASALNHPNIITIHEIGESDGTHFIATEFIDGKTLNEYVKGNSLNLKSVLEIAIQIASALDEAHSAGIVHRDIKPDNVMIRANGLAKILDFGIAKLAAPSETGEEAATAIQGATTPGMIIGTPNYMSPEQARGKGVDRQTDIFSFGVVLYEMLAGSAPFAGETVSDVIAAVLTKEPKPVAGVPPELAAIIRKSLQKDKPKRYRTAKDLLDDLTEVKQELEIQSRLGRNSAPNLDEPKTQILQARTTAETETQNSIVVLPFTNLSADEDNEYFSDGLTEELITDLSKIRSLRVISRNSAMRLKGTAKDLKTITSELGVRYVLDGSVRKAGQGVRISVQLIDGATDANLWSEKYSGALADIFEMQERVSRSIADALKIKLSAIEIKQIEERPIADARAYDLYLQARAKYLQGDPAGLDRSIELLKQGIEIIGENELLYAALGYAYYFYFRWVSKLDENYLRLANECVVKAFAINPSSSHGFSLKGMLSYSEGNISEAIGSLEKAIALQPTNTEALLWLAIYGEYIEDFYEPSMRFIDKVRLLDPLLPLNTLIKGFIHIFNGEFKESLPWLEKGLAMDDSAPLSLWAAAIGKAWCGKTDEAIAHVDRLAEIAPGWVYTQHALFLKHALRGEKDLAMLFATDELSKEAEHDCHFALHVAHCFALIREAEKALDFLDISVRTGMVNYRFLSRLDPLLENIRHEQRFQSLMTEARQLSEKISSSAPDTDFQRLSENIGDAGTQILQATTAKSPTPNANSEEGFWVAVLPFKYRGANADAEALAEGLSEEIITGLSRFSYLKVIARGSTSRFGNEAADIRAVGKELGARFVLEGSLRQVGTTIRLSVQLVDASTGTHLWAETYDRQFQTEQIFAVQDELVPRIVSTVADQHGVLVHSMAELLRNKSSEQITPYEAVLCVFGFHERMTAEEHAKARDLLERVVREFPDQGNCWAMLETLYCDEYMFGFNPRPDSLGRALSAARHAIETAPTSNLACQALAQAHFFRREFEAFRPLAERTIALNPMDGATVALMGVLIACSGEWEQGCAVTEQAMRLNPHFPGWYRLALLFNAYRRSDYRAALSEAQRINIPNYFWALVMSAAALGQLGESEKAREALDALLAARPDFSDVAPEEFGRWFDAEMVAHLMEGLRKAGLETASAPKQEEQKTLILTAIPTAEENPQPAAPLPVTNLSTDEEAVDETVSSSTTDKKSGSQNPKSKWRLSVLLGLILIVGAYFGYRYFTPNSKQIESIAVLPFVNESGNADFEYLSDGMTETLIKSLSQLSNLNVKPRSSVFRYKGKDTDLQTIARELNVQAILTGRVVQRGDQLTLSLELVDVRRDSVIWTESYNRKQSELVTLQSEIAKDVSTNLKTKLSGAEETKVTKTATSDPEAYQAYLKGRYYWNRRTTENLKKAIEQFKIATDRDPNYALAFVGLADCYVVLHEYAGIPTSETIPQAKAYAERALSLDSQLAEPHSTLGALNEQLWQWAEAEKEHKRAIEINPNYATAYQWYSILLKNLGRNDEAAAMIKRAHELDPLSSVISVNVSRMYQLQNNHEASIENSLKIIELDPNFGPAYEYLGLSYLKRGRNVEAVAALGKAAELTNRSSITLGHLGYAYAATGKRTEAIAIIKELEDKYARKEANGQYAAYVYVGLDEKDKAFEWLEKDFQARNGKLAEIRWQLPLESLSDDPRFKNLLKRMNLPE